MEPESTSPYPTICYTGFDCAAGDSPLAIERCSGSTLEPGRGSTSGWPSALNPACNRSMRGGLGRPTSSPECGRAKLQPLNNPFVFSARSRSRSVHANHSYHIVGYDARKKFRESVAYRYLRASRRASARVTLYRSVSYSVLGLGRRGPKTGRALGALLGGILAA